MLATAESKSTEGPETDQKPGVDPSISTVSDSLSGVVPSSDAAVLELKNKVERLVAEVRIKFLIQHR